MPYLVANGALLECSQGSAPAPLVLGDRAFVADGLQLANIHDFQPMTNITSFAMCRSLANPQVQTATAAAMGALTPMPCVPVTMPWTRGSPYLSQNPSGPSGPSLPVLTTKSTCQCAYAGEITVKKPNCTVKIDG